MEDWRNVVKTLIEEKRIIFTDEDIWEAEDFLKKVNYIRLTDSGDIDVYVLLPFDAKNVSTNLISAIWAVVEAMWDDSVDLSDVISFEQVNEITARIVCEKPLTWMLKRIAESYGIPASEVVENN